MHRREQTPIRSQPHSFPVELHVNVQGFASGEDLVTHTIHPQGAFIATESPAPTQQLIRCEFIMPNGPRVDVWAAVDYVIPPADAGKGQPAGMGVLFYAMDDSAKLGWRKLYEDVTGKPLPVDTRSESTTGQGRRRAMHTPAPLSRHTPLPLPTVTGDEAEVELTPRDVRSLMRLINKELARGQVLLRADGELPIGTPCAVWIRHPMSGETVSVPGQAAGMTGNGTLKIRVFGLSQDDFRTLQHFAVTGRVPS